MTNERLPPCPLCGDMTEINQHVYALDWIDLDDFDAILGDVVLRRWRYRETGEYKYALVESWRGKESYLHDSQFALIDSQHPA